MWVQIPPSVPNKQVAQLVELFGCDPETCEFESHLADSV